MLFLRVSGESFVFEIRYIMKVDDDKKMRDNIKWVEIKEKNILNRTRKKLEKNKIFFEIFSSVLLAAMGLIVSVVGVQINERDQQTNKRQLEIIEENREPFFTIKGQEIYEEVEETQDTNAIAIKRYTIKNEGGIIHDVSIKKYACAIIYIQKDKNIVGEYNIFKYTFPDFFFNLLDSMPLTQKKDANKDIVFYEYGIEKKHIDEDVYEFDFEDIFWMLEEDIKKRFLCDIILRRKNYIELTYTNYKNEKYTKIFEFEINNMWISNEEEEFIDLGYCTKVKVDEMGEEVQKLVEKWIKEN